MDYSKTDYNNIIASIMLIDSPYRLESDVLELLNLNSSCEGLLPEQNLFLLILQELESDNFKSDHFEKIISIVVKSGDLKKYITLCFISSFNISHLSIITKLSVMFMLEGDGENKRWVHFLKSQIANELDRDTLFYTIEINTITRGSVVIRGRKCGIPFFNAHKAIRVLRTESERVLTSYDANQINLKEATQSFSVSSIKKNSLLNPFLHFMKKKSKPNTGKLEKIQGTNDDLSILVVLSRAFPGPDNTHFNYLLNTLTALKHAQPNVKMSLCISGEDYLVSPWNNFGLMTKRFLQFHKEKWAPLFNGSNSIFPFFVDQYQTFDKVERIQSCVDYIDSVAPSLVVFLTGVYESRVTLSLVHKKYPTVYLPTSLSHVPEKNFDYIISPSPIYKNKLIAKGLENNRVINIPTVINVFQDNSDITEKLFHKEENDFVLATVLGAGRIAQTFDGYDATDISELESLFIKIPNLKWIFVGEIAHEKILNKSAVFVQMHKDGRIIFIDYLQKLRGFFRLVDAVFNIPNVTGAGQTLAAASYEGLPCVSSIVSDPIVYLPENCIYFNVSEAVNIVVTIALDPNKRIAMGRSCFENVTACTAENAGRSWMKFLEKYL